MHAPASSMDGVFPLPRARDGAQVTDEPSRGDPEQGLTHAREAVRLAPDFPPNSLALSEALVRNGLPDEARRVCEQAEQSARKRIAAGAPDAGEWLDEAARAAAALP